ncbi:MAG: FaeA/PapI family transcriptional regulator [Nanoarchaeota archaeon]
MKESILKVINNSEKPLSTSEIAQNLNKSWHTVIRYCLDLENDGKLTKFGVGRINIWQKKK